MIGLYRRWHGEPLPHALGDRFAASLGVGSGKSTKAHHAAGAVLASTTTGKASAWRPALTQGGAPLLFLGHIDNRSELRRLLQMPASAADPALYAAAYSAWGDDADLKVGGTFVTMIWSEHANSIRLSSSPISAPALHIWHDHERAIVASAARAIFATGEVEQRVDEQKIADSLFLNYKEGERGWFVGVSRLPRGARAIITPRGVTVTRYYDVHSLPNVRLRRDEDYVEAARALFDEGTRAALEGFSKPAVSISGGFDSQAVAAFALAARPDDRILGLTSVPEKQWDGRTLERHFGDERSHVEAFAAMHPRFDPEWVDAAGLSFDHKLDAMFLLAGAPPRNAINFHWIHEVSRIAKARGRDVVLTGQIGNGTFSFDGHGAFPGWFMQGRWLRLFRELRAIDDDMPLWRKFRSRVIRPLLPKAISGPIMQRRHPVLHSPFDRWCPLDPEWAREMRVAERAAAFGFDPLFRGRRSTRDWRAEVLGNGSNESGDLQAALETIHGIPRRDPTAYRPLVEFCIGIPDDQYIRNGQTRWLARRILKDMLPVMVLEEKRRGLQAADWHIRMTRNLDSLRSEVARLAADPGMAKRLNLSGLQASLADWPSSTPVGPEGEQLQLAVSRALTTARFIRYVEGRNET